MGRQAYIAASADFDILAIAERPIGRTDMLPQTEMSVIACARTLRERYSDRAEQMVRRQISWSRERGSDDEITYWSAVLERLTEASSRVARIHVLPEQSSRSRRS